jgi:RNA polymerase sigma factor (sigma-70 family)
LKTKGACAPTPTTWDLESHAQDIALWESFKDGDTASFHELFRKYYSSLYLYGYKITQDKELLEDCIQDLFTELWTSPSKTQVKSVKAYLLKSLQYKVLKGLQKRSKFLLSDDDTSAPGFEISHDNLMILREDQQDNGNKIKSAMTQLSRRQQEIIYLRFFQNLSYEEISDVMDINYQVARNLLYQSIKALRKSLMQPI